MILFDSIRWKNFLSAGDQWIEIKLDESMSTLIIGSNGAGKSTILDALCFALFNRPFRRVKKSQLINSINEKGTKVEVCFSIGSDDYRVFRSMKPNTFEVYKNNKMVDQDAAVKDTQKYLEQSVLKLNFKSFTQVVILGSSTFVPFMQLAAPHRREVIEDLLDIGIFSSMNTLLKDKVRSAIGQSKDCDHMLRLSEEKVSAQKTLIQSLEAVNETRREEKIVKIAQNEESIFNLTGGLAEMKTQVELLESEYTGSDAPKRILQDLRQQQADNKSAIKITAAEIKFFSENNVCPTCHQSIDEEFKTNKITESHKEGKKYERKVKKLEKTVKETIDIIDKLDDISSKLYESRSEVSQMEKEIIRVEKDNIQLTKEMSDIVDHQSITHIEDELVELENEYKKVETDCSSINKTLDEYKVVSTLLKDGGIKSQIIKKYVPVINKLINKYLQSMDFYINFTLDEEFNEIIKSRFRDEFSYASFSDGEKQKIDLALLFTWREIARMKNSVATNLLILDEVFDSSLDDQATGELLKILRSLGVGTNVFVISHKGDILIDKFLKTIKFEKQNDFSKMSEES